MTPVVRRWAQSILTLNRKIEILLVLYYRFGAAARWQTIRVRTEKKERSRKGQQADALALEGEEGRDKLR